MANLEQSRTKLVGELDLIQKKAFTKWVNSHLEKVGIEVTDLFQDLRDGSILLTLLEMFTGVKLPKEKGKMRVHHIQNVKTAINFLTEQRKIRIVGIPVEEIVGGNNKLTLGLVWMLILNFELSGAIPSEPGERPMSPKEVSAKQIKKELLDWAKAATEGYDEVKVTNFHTSWKDGMAFCAIINRHRPDLLDYDDCDPSKPLENLEGAFSVAKKELDVIRFLDPEDVNIEKPPEEAILMYVSALRQAFPEMPPPHRRKGPPVSPEEYTSCYSTLQDWINTRRQMVAVRDFPPTSAEVSKLLEEFKTLRTSEDHEKEKEKDEVRRMAAELNVFAMKRRTELNIPPIEIIEQAWSAAMSESDDYEKALESELERLEKQEKLVQEIQSDLLAVSSSLDSIDKSTTQIENDSVSMTTEEVTGKVSDLQISLKATQDSVDSICEKLQTLKDCGYTEMGPLEEQVTALQDRLSSLQSRLEGFLSSVGDAQLLLAEADSKLKDCEKWLIKNGKFAENQLILDQISDYQSFQSNELTQASVVMEKINSTPFPGMEEAVEDLNKRWDSIQEQIKNRLSKLESISETVSQFDSIKSPLESWCLQHQETFSSLPLLETDAIELKKQKENFETLLKDILVHKENVETLEELSDQFTKSREPIQSSADKFTRKLKRQSSVFSVTTATREPSEGIPDMSLFEQSGVLKDQWERYKVQVELRLQQSDDLLNRLLQFEEMYKFLRELINEGRGLLDSEKPVGDSAEKIAQQTSTCQTFRQRLTEAQPQVDAMLSLGRSIIGEHFTNHHKDTLSHTLTDFIQDWSNLLLAWQNWYDELHATGEQSQDLSDQFNKLKQALFAIEPDYKELFPAAVTVENLKSDLKDLQDTFTKEVYEPLISQKPIFTSLSAKCHLLPNKDDIEKTLSQFQSLLEKVEENHSELADVIDNVGCWWTEFETVRSKVMEMREELTDARPLGGSVPVVQTQDEEVQAILLKVEECKPKYQRSLRNLLSVAGHKTILLPEPITQCHDELKSNWEELYEQAENRRDLVETGRVRLNVYLECRDPFDVWLGQTEAKLSQWNRVDYGGKDVLVEQTEALKAFKTDVELHSHDLVSCETLGGKFIETAKKHQALLLSYKRKLHPEHTRSCLLPEGFFDWESDGFKSPSTASFDEGEHPLQSHTYDNGLQVISADVHAEKKRYQKLKARVARRTQRYEEAREKRLACEEAFQAVLPKLEGAESLIADIKTSGLGKNSVKSLREQLEMMETLESEFSELRSLMDPLHMTVAAWSVREPTDSEAEEEEGGEDECVIEKEKAQKRYEAIQESLRSLREELESSLAEAQAFQSAYSSFVSWLRDTERKIQRDNQLKLEVNDLKSGLAYLKAVSADISAHEELYHDLCGRFHTILDIMKGEEKEETKEKLENLETRWSGLQVIHEDIEVITDIIPQLESFYVSHRQLILSADNLLEKLAEYSPSTNTTEGAEKKRVELEGLTQEYTSIQTQFDALLAQCASLLDTPFDQTRFQGDVNSLKEKLKQCKQMKDEKTKALKHITNRLKTLELDWMDFETWLASNEEKIHVLNNTLGKTGVNMTEQLKEAQQLQEDITEHEMPLDSMESLISSLSTYLEQLHIRELDARFNTLNSRYRTLGFETQAYPMEVWLQSRFTELNSMQRCAVLVLPLTSQVHHAGRFQHQIDAYLPLLSELEGVVSSLPDQSDSSSPKIKMECILKDYSKLRNLTSKRLEMLTMFLPRVKLYEGSLENWERVLLGWEESASLLAPPTAITTLIQSQIETIKSLQSEISDHEPEFHAHLREAQKMYLGPEEEPAYLDEMKGLALSVSPLPTEDTRQGQSELQGRLDEDRKRLENLKRTLSERLALLIALYDNLKKFDGHVNQLLPWLQEQVSSVDELSIKVPTFQVLQDQLTSCQSLQNHFTKKSSQRDEIVQMYHSITTALSSDDTELPALKNQLDEIQQMWSDLSDKLSSAQASLEPAVKLARSYEKEKDRLTSWVKRTLEELTGLGSIPSEPEAVQELKIKIDDLKSEYNSLAPCLAQCNEEGLQLASYIQDSTQKDLLTSNVHDLQKDWDSVGNLLSDIHQKLTDALMQTQEFQQVADSLERWVNATQNAFKCLELVAARVRLIESQIEGFKPILEDIKINYTALEQAKVIGSKVAAEATTEERLKIEKRLHALEMRFYGLDKAGKSRMSDLQDAQTKAIAFEGNCSQLSEWLKTMEDRMLSWPATPIRSQALKTLEQEAKDFNQTVQSHEPVIQDMSSSETALFYTDLPTLLCYENQENLSLIVTSMSPRRQEGAALSPNQPTEGSMLESSVDTAVHPEFLKRPGAVEAIEGGAKIRRRFDKLKIEVGRKRDETTQCLQAVLNYESNYKSFSDWLDEMVAKLQDISPLLPSCNELKSQLQLVQGLQHDVQNKQPTLESINATGTSLVDGCRDDLSRDSVRESLSELNEKWGNLLSKLDEKSEKLAEGIKLCVEYETQEKEFDSWLTGCEEKLAKPVLGTGLTGGLDHVLKNLKDLQADITAKKDQLDTTVTAGQALESFISASSEVATPPSILGYIDLQRRYDNLAAQLNKKMKDAEVNISKAEDLRLQLRTLLGQLKSLKSTLESHEPPHLLPDLVKEQLQQLETISSQWSALQSPVEDLLNSVKDFTTDGEDDIGILSNDLSSCNDDVKSLLDQWHTKLQNVLETSTQFEKDYKEFTGWVNGIQLKTGTDEGVSATVDGVKKQIEETEALKSEITEHQQALQDLMNLGRGMMGGASPEDCVQVGDRLAQVQASYESVQRHVFGRMRILKDGLKMAEDFAKTHEDVLNCIETRTTDLTMMSAVGTDIETVKIQLEDFKEFETELQEIKPKITNCLTKGKQLKESCHHDDRPWVDARLDEINTSWAKLQLSCQSRQHQLENALLRLGQFREALGELLEWIDESKNALGQREAPGVSLEDLETQMNELQALQSEIVAREPSVGSLNEAGKKLIAGNHDDTSAEIQKDVNELNEKWDSLKNLTADKQLTLSTALERARGFHSNWKSIVDRLNEAEEQSVQDWIPHGLPDTCQADIDEHKTFTALVHALKDPINDLKDEAELLKSQGSDIDQEIVDRWISDVEERLEEIIIAAEDKQTQLEEAKSKADQFDEAFKNLSDQLDQLDKQAKDQSVIHSEAEAVKEQLENHMTFLKQLEELETHIEELEGNGASLMKNCVKEDGDNIKDKLEELRSHYDSLQTDALSQLSKLEEALLTLGQFEDAYRELRGWLGKIWDQLQNPEPIAGQADHIAGLLAKHKALQKEISARATSYKSVTKAGKELMKTKVGEDKNVLKRKLTDLEQEWEGVCQMSAARQQKLEDALKKLRQFESQIQPLKSWMNKVLPTLDDSEPVYGDVATVHELTDDHEAFQRELGSHQKSIDAINTAGQHLLNEVLDAPSPTKEQLDELNEMWAEICNKSIQKQDRLQQAKKAAYDFSQGVRTLWGWTEEMERVLDKMAPPADDVEQLQQQIEEQEIFKQTVLAQQPHYEKILEAGSNLHQLAHPRAEPILQGQLQQLEQKWMGLKTKMNNRSEALASNMLEVYGLQDMLEKLSVWVQEAEETLGTAEGTPLGDDLESVEQQLAEHESFQEEMATHQPNMDALNKAAKRRKSKVSLTPTSASHPDMTKRIGHLYKRWQKLWLRSSERHRQLLEARTRLKDIALARSFNFEAWCKRFVAWVDQQKLRVNDLFRRFDTNHDGMLTREEFMKGLKASGLAMNQIEMEKIADTFDKNKNGLIDLSDIMAILKGQKSKRKFQSHPGPARSLSDAEKIDMEIHHQVSKCCCPHKFKVIRVGEGQYRFGDSQKLRLVRILRSTVMVRVGGGWEPLEEFLSKNDPCRVSGRTNAELRDILGTDQPSYGLTQAGFRRKTQTAIHAKNEALRAAASKDSESEKVSKTLPSGRQETVITKRTSLPATRGNEGPSDSKSQRTQRSSSTITTRSATPTQRDPTKALSPSREGHVRSKTPIKQPIRDKTPPTHLNSPERVPSRTKTPARNGSLGAIRVPSDKTPSEGPTSPGATATPGTPTRHVSKIPTPSGSKIPTPSRGKPPRR